MAHVAPYRASAARTLPVVVDYRHASPWWAVCLAIVLAFALVHSCHRVELWCARSADGSGTCQVRDARGFWLSEGQRIDLARLRGAKVVLLPDRGAPTRGTQIVLLDEDGDVDLPTAGESTHPGEDQAFVRRIQGFLADPSVPRLEAGYGERWGVFLTVFCSLVFGIPFLIVFGAFFCRVRVVVDRANGTLRIQRSRLLAPATDETYELGAMREIVVEESHRREATAATYRLTLVLPDQRVPLTREYSWFLAPQERAARAINRALSDRS